MEKSLNMKMSKKMMKEKISDIIKSLDIPEITNKKWKYSEELGLHFIISKDSIKFAYVFNITESDDCILKFLKIEDDGSFLSMFINKLGCVAYDIIDIDSNKELLLKADDDIIKINDTCRKAAMEFESLLDENVFTDAEDAEFLDKAYVGAKKFLLAKANEDKYYWDCNWSNGKGCFNADWEACSRHGNKTTLEAAIEGAKKHASNHRGPDYYDINNFGFTDIGIYRVDKKDRVFGVANLRDILTKEKKNSK
jgi:hypothetical protein